MKIGFLGGTFNPPHLSHKDTAYSAMEKFALEKVFFIPSANPPHKQNILVPKKDRFEMTKLLIENEPRFEISDIEMKRGGKSFTKDTIETLKRIYPNDEIFWIIGMDSFISMPTWKHADNLLNMCQFVVVTRKGYGVGKDLKHMISRVKFVDKIGEIDISSTELREKIRRGEDVSKYFPSRILDFIETKKLYVKDAIM